MDALMADPLSTCGVCFGSHGSIVGMQMPCNSGLLGLLVSNSIWTHVVSFYCAGYSRG